MYVFGGGSPSFRTFKCIEGRTVEKLTNAAGGPVENLPSWQLFEFPEDRYLCMSDPIVSPVNANEILILRRSFSSYYGIDELVRKTSFVYDTRTDAIELLEEGKFDFGSSDNSSSFRQIRKNLILSVVRHKGPCILTYDKFACNKVKIDFR